MAHPALATETEQLGNPVSDGTPVVFDRPTVCSLMPFLRPSTAQVSQHAPMSPVS